jgi:hypothetical protein
MPSDEDAPAEVRVTERERIEAVMREGYLETLDDRRALNQDWETVDGEG